MGVFMDFKKSQHRLPCPQTYQVANKQPSTFSTTKRPSFWLSKTLSFASIHYDGESGRLDEFVLKFSPKWIRLEAKIQIANFRLRGETAGTAALSATGPWGLALQGGGPKLARAYLATRVG